MIVYGAEISYFTGKLEAYLRYKGIPYELRTLGMYEYLWKVPRKLGATQYPSVELPDGRWMSDTTPMIAWLEVRHPERAVLPVDRAQAFFALLIEDFGDEWLWRPAMHYRWSNAVDRRLMGVRLAEEIVRMPAPLWLRARWVAYRQAKLFVRGDGIDRHSRGHADRSYLRVLDRLEPVFAERPFLFGDQPTVADFGLFGSMGRHFSPDPTPGRIMRNRAPAVSEWVARLWNARGERLGGAPLLDGLPADLEPLLQEAGETHLQMLAANAAAHAAGEDHHDLHVQGAVYRSVPTSPYRVWALEQLQQRFAELGQADRELVEQKLRACNCWAPLWRVADPQSGHDPRGTAPFCRTTRMVRD